MGLVYNNSVGLFLMVAVFGEGKMASKKCHCWVDAELFPRQVKMSVLVLGAVVVGTVGLLCVLLRGLVWVVRRISRR